MKKGLTELVFILDRSGSMGGLESDTIGGFNGMLKKQQKETLEENTQANVTTVLFDDSIDVIHDRFPISVVKPLTDKDYYVRGCTALLDAVGGTIKKMENIQKRLPKDMRAEKVIFVITTDGQENASREYTASKVRKMISKRQEKGWQFIFMGANIDAVTEAENLGIRSTHAVTYRNDSKGVGLNYCAMGSVISSLRSVEINECSEDELDEMITACMRPVAEYEES